MDFKLKVKVALLRLEHRRGAHLPFQGREPVGGNTTIVCDVWQCDARPTIAFPACADAKLILLCDWGTCVCKQHVLRGSRKWNRRRVDRKSGALPVRHATEPHRGHIFQYKALENNLGHLPPFSCCVPQLWKDGSGTTHWETLKLWKREPQTTL